MTAAGVAIASLLGLLALLVAAAGLSDAGDAVCVHYLSLEQRPDHLADADSGFRSDYEPLRDRFKCTYTRRDGGSIVSYVDR